MFYKSIDSRMKLWNEWTFFSNIVYRMFAFNGCIRDWLLQLSQTLLRENSRWFLFSINGWWSLVLFYGFYYMTSWKYCCNILSRNAVPTFECVHIIFLQKTDQFNLRGRYERRWKIRCWNIFFSYIVLL